MQNHYLHTLCIATVRYIPVIMAVAMLIHVITLLMGYNLPIADVLTSQSLATFAFFMVISHAFKFCIWHRMIILYNYVVSLCIDYQRNVGFGQYLLIARILTFVIGFLLVILVLSNTSCHAKDSIPHRAADHPSVA